MTWAVPGVCPRRTELQLTCVSLSLDWREAESENESGKADNEGMLKVDFIYKIFFPAKTRYSGFPLLVPQYM